MKFTTIEEIRAYPWTITDVYALNAADAFINSADVSVDDKYEALDIVGQRAMGLPPLARDYPNMTKQQVIDEHKKGYPSEPAG